MDNCCAKWSRAGSFFLRVPLGLLFLLAGISKLGDPAGFVATVNATVAAKVSWLPASLATAYGYGLPYVEIVAGAAAILGFFSKWSGWLMSLMLLSFVIAMGVMTKTGGLNKDIALLGASLYLALKGSRFWSIDGLIKR